MQAAAVEQQHRQAGRERRQRDDAAGSRTSRIAQTKSGMRIHDIPRARMFTIVTMKLIAPASDAIVRMWSARIQ